MITWCFLALPNKANLVGPFPESFNSLFFSVLWQFRPFYFICCGPSLFPASNNMLAPYPRILDKASNLISRKVSLYPLPSLHNFIFSSLSIQPDPISAWSYCLGLTTVFRNIWSSNRPRIPPASLGCNSTSGWPEEKCRQIQRGVCMVLREEASIVFLRRRLLASNREKWVIPGSPEGSKESGDSRFPNASPQMSSTYDLDCHSFLSRFLAPS